MKIHAEEVFRMENVRERLAKSVHFHLLLDRMSPGDIAELRQTILRNAGEKKGFLHAIRPGEFDAVIALARRMRRGPVPGPGAGPSRPFRLRRPASPRMIPESRDERALLVYAHRKRARGPAAVLHVAEVMDELQDLVLAAGAKVVASRVQSVDAENPATVVGKGTHRPAEGGDRNAGCEPGGLPEPAQAETAGASRRGARREDPRPPRSHPRHLRPAGAHPGGEAPGGARPAVVPAREARGRAEGTVAARRRDRDPGTGGEEARGGPPPHPRADPAARAGADHGAPDAFAPLSAAPGSRVPGGRARRVHQRREIDPLQPA